MVNSNSTFTYTPANNFLGNDSFTFKANDGTVGLQRRDDDDPGPGGPDRPERRRPTDFPAIMQGSGPTAIPVLANDVDKQGGPLTIESVTQGPRAALRSPVAGPA